MATSYHFCFYVNIHKNVSFNTFSFSYKQGLNKNMYKVCSFIDEHLNYKYFIINYKQFCTEQQLTHGTFTEI